MKKTITILIAAVTLAMLVPTGASAQRVIVPLNREAYAANAKDTVLIQRGRWTSAPHLETMFLVRDSGKADVILEYRDMGSSGAWTAVITDSLIYADTLSYQKPFTIRNNTTELVPRVSVEYRWRINWRAAGQGFTSPTYDLEIWRGDD